MINLLPSEFKKDIAYARKNTKLRRWIAASAVSLVGVGIIIAGGLFFIQQSINSRTVKLEASKKALQAQKVGQTQAG